MKKVHLAVDGIEVEADEGTTILSAAESVGIEIPTICYEKGLSPSGNCRVCVVEVEGAKTLVGACHTPISEGMVVHTASPRVQKARLATIELLMAGHTGNCVTDISAQECRLHTTASSLEVGTSRFRVKEPRFFAEENENPYVIRDMSKCILCRKCIRACKEVARQDVYSVAYRGFSSKVVVDCDSPLHKEICKDCGICIEYCATNALRWPDGKDAGIANAGLESHEHGLQTENRTQLLDLLRTQQRVQGHLSEAFLSEIATSFDMSLSEVFGVATFYSFLSTRALGRHVIRVCKSLPCYLRNGRMIVEEVGRALDVRPGETTADGLFSLELTNCIGACDRAPAMLIDDTVYGDLTPDRVSDILALYR